MLFHKNVSSSLFRSWGRTHLLGFREPGFGFENTQELIPFLVATGPHTHLQAMKGQGDDLGVPGPVPAPASSYCSKSVVWPEPAWAGPLMDRWSAGQRIRLRDSGLSLPNRHLSGLFMSLKEFCHYWMISGKYSLSTFWESRPGDSRMGLTHENLTQHTCGTLSSHKPGAWQTDILLDSEPTIWSTWSNVKSFKAGYYM